MSSGGSTNKIAGAVLSSLLVTVAIGHFGAALFPGDHGGHEALAYPVPHGEEGPVQEVVEEAEPSVLPYMLEASAEDGADAFGVCMSCHTNNEGGANGLGPNLWNVVGRDVATVEGFNYSAPIQEYPGDWTYEALSAFLHAPQEEIPGTGMGYAGMADVEDRADLIAYLRTLSGDPVPLPTQEEVDAVLAAEAEAAAPPEEGGEEGGEDVEGDEGATDEGAPEEDVTDEGAPEEDATDEAAPEEDATDEAAPEEDATDEVAPEEDATDEGAPEEDAATDEAADTEGDVAALTGLAAAVAEASVENGEAQFQPCGVCHSRDANAQTLLGPPMWNVVGRDVAGVEGFRYSGALQEIGGTWTLEKLSGYLENPAQFAPGNSMPFVGIADEQARIDLIAYLHTLADEPVALETVSEGE